MIVSVITVIVNILMIIEYDRPLEWALGSPASRAAYWPYIQSKVIDDPFQRSILQNVRASSWDMGNRWSYEALFRLS